MWGISDVELAFFEGALVGAAIHLTGALWYTRRQRVRFELDVNKRLEGARASIVGELTTKMEKDWIPSISARVAGSVGGNIKAARAEVRAALADEEETGLEEELAQAFGKSDARKLIVGGKVIDRFRKRRQLKKGQVPGSDAPTSPAGSTAPPSTPGKVPAGQIHPQILAALEAAGFKREAKPIVPNAPAADPERPAETEASN